MPPDRPRRLAAAFASLILLANGAIETRVAEAGHPAHSLAMPFDLRDGRVTFLVVSHVAAGVTRLQPVDLHTTWWDDAGTLIDSTWTCLQAHRTEVIDPGPFLPPGASGLAIFTAYQQGPACASRNDPRPADDVLTGSFTIAWPEDEVAFGHDAFAVGLAPAGHADLPGAAQGRTGPLEAVSFPVFASRHTPGSFVTLMGLRERGGPPESPAELGPLEEFSVAIPMGVTTPARERLTLPAIWSSPLSDLVPDDESANTSRLITLHAPMTSGNVLGDPDAVDGNDTWLWGFVGHSLGRYGATGGMKYPHADGSGPPFDRPTPTGRLVPRPTPTRSPGVVQPDPSASPSPLPSPSALAPDPTETPNPTPPRPTDAPTPMSPSPAPTPRGTPTSGPSPTGSPVSPPATATPILPPQTPTPPPPVATSSPAGSSPTPTAGPTPTVQPTAPPAPTPCTQLDATLRVGWPSGVAIHAAVVSLPYAGTALSLPTPVGSRVGTSPLAPGTLFEVNGGSAEIVIGVASIEPVPNDWTVDVRFDCAGPPPPELPCTIEAGSDTGLPVATTCFVELEPAP